MEIKIESEGYGDDKLKDLGVGKKILDVLEKYYAGHDWFVNCSHEAGTATVQLMYEGPDEVVRIWKYGYLLHLNKLDDMDKKVMMAGGEVLERYNMARTAIRENSLVDFYSKEVNASGMVQ